MDSKYQLTDIVEIVNYGQILELLDSDVNLLFPKAKLINTITREDGTIIYRWDFRTDLIGKKTVVVGIIDNGTQIKYRVTDMAINDDLYLFNEEQLKLVTK